MISKAFDPGPLAHVSQTSAGKHVTLVFVREFNHPIAKVWAALTAPDQLGRWAPFEPDRNLATTGPATLVMTDGSPSEPLASTVIRVEAPRLLEYTWAEHLLLWELESTAVGTRLTLRHTVDDKDLLAKVAAGWHICLVVADQLIKGEPMPRILGVDAMDYGWEELRSAYARDLGGI